MKTIAENIETLERLLKEVNDHCMCAWFESTSDAYQVIYPIGYFPNGVRCNKGMGKAKALKRILSTMEKHWQESCWWNN